MIQIFDWVQTHGVVLAVPAFTLASITLKAIGDGFQALGKQAPSWVGSALGWIGTVVHFINGK